MKRLFVALDIPRDVRLQAAGARDALVPELRSAARWTAPENMHLTLVFLGECDPGREALVRGALAEVRFSSFAMRLGGGGCFPGPRRPRVVWLGLREGETDVVRLHGDIVSALGAAGERPEARPFRPHLTLARVTSPRPEAWDQLATVLRSLRTDVFSVDAFLLYESELTPDGPIYSVLDAFPAAGADQGVGHGVEQDAGPGVGQGSGQGVGRREERGAE